LSQSQIPYTVYTLEKEITNSRGDLIWKYESPVVLKFHKSVWKYVVSYLLTAYWLHLVLYFSAEYHNIPFLEIFS
jgi:hypothetical protein